MGIGREGLGWVFRGNQKRDPEMNNRRAALLVFLKSVFRSIHRGINARGTRCLALLGSRAVDRVYLHACHWFSSVSQEGASLYGGCTGDKSLGLNSTFDRSTFGRCFGRCSCVRLAFPLVLSWFSCCVRCIAACVSLGVTVWYYNTYRKLFLLGSSFD